MNAFGTVPAILLVTTALTGSALLLLGCGSGDDDRDASAADARLEELLERLPITADLDIAMSVDLAAARRQLGLPSTADPTGERLQDADPLTRTRFRYIADPVLRWVIAAPGGDRITGGVDPAIARAVDSGAISLAVAAPARVGQVIVIQTGQSFQELAGALEERGFAREGALLVTSPGRARFEPHITAVADAGDGVIVFAASRMVAEAALASSDLSPAEDLLMSVPGVGRSASVFETDEDDCVRGVGIGQDLDPPEAEILVEVDSDADAEAFALAEREDYGAGSFEFETPGVGGDELSVRARYDPKGLEQGIALTRGPIGLALAPFSTFYRCG